MGMSSEIEKWEAGVTEAGEIQNPVNAIQRNSSTSKAPQIVLPEQPRVLAAQKWEGKAQQVQQKIQAAYGNHRTYHGYCNKLYHCYLVGFRETSEDEPAYAWPFDKASRVMEHFRAKFQTYKLKLLENCGEEREYFWVAEMEGNAMLALSAINDLLCEALMGRENIKQKYERGQLEFQKGEKARIALAGCN
ncbi:hypothetical protein V5O48_016252 [Marasmius crinis-equi]|uniref:Uncharacterized protein n=1 Tax=Marasmius crinis-equi TaxID=585013 RepID=A0ABR3ES93_9AGAR